jgi:hypothetical protein
MSSASTDNVSVRISHSEEERQTPGVSMVSKMKPFNPCAAFLALYIINRKDARTSHSMPSTHSSHAAHDAPMPSKLPYLKSVVSAR